MYLNPAFCEVVRNSPVNQEVLRIHWKRVYGIGNVLEYLYFIFFPFKKFFLKYS